MALLASAAILLTARTSNGSDGAVYWQGGKGLFSVWGTPNGATVTLSWSPNAGTTYLDTDGAALTAAGTVSVEYPAGYLKATISAAGGSTSLNAKVSRVPP